MVRHESGVRAHLAVLEGNDAHKIGVVLLQLRQLPGKAALSLPQAAAPWQVLLLHVAAESGIERLAMRELMPAGPRRCSIVHVPCRGQGGNTPQQKLRLSQTS